MVYIYTPHFLYSLTVDHAVDQLLAMIILTIKMNHLRRAWCQFRIGLARMERNVRERMSVQDNEVLTPQQIIYK